MEDYNHRFDQLEAMIEDMYERLNARFNALEGPKEVKSNKYSKEEEDYLRSLTMITFAEVETYNRKFGKDRTLNALSLKHKRLKNEL